MHFKIPSKLSFIIGAGAGIVFLSIIILITTLDNHPIFRKMSYHSDIIDDTKNNTNFRRVLFTGQNSQLVVMSIPPGGEIGEETHNYTEQTLFFLSGTGEGVLNGRKIKITPGIVVVVTPGTKHNFWNTGTQDLKVYTVYSPPNHIDGRVHPTKADADADTADEAIGESRPSK